MIMNPYQISTDPVWHRWVDGIVILAIGLAAGVVITSMFMYGQTITVVETVRSVQTTPQLESGISTRIPSSPRIDEI